MRSATRAQRRYEIADLVDRGVDEDGKELYRALWQGCSLEDSTWELATNLQATLVRRYPREGSGDEVTRCVTRPCRLGRRSSRARSEKEES